MAFLSEGAATRFEVLIVFDQDFSVKPYVRSSVAPLGSNGRPEKGTFVWAHFDRP
jgi:hypothetical protein